MATTVKDSTRISALPANTVKTSDDEVGSEYTVYYVAIADTGDNYYKLDKLMYDLGTALHIKVDTMDRYYDVSKKHIVLPEDYEDEMYRGEYYPRRDGDDFLSIEYTALFDTSASERNMCMVAGLFSTKKSADSILMLLKPISPKAFVIKASVYEGCLH